MQKTFSRNVKYYKSISYPYAQRQSDIYRVRIKNRIYFTVRMDIEVHTRFQKQAYRWCKIILQAHTGIDRPL